MTNYVVIVQPLQKLLFSPPRKKPALQKYYYIVLSLRDLQNVLRCLAQINEIYDFIKKYLLKIKVFKAICLSSLQRFLKLC